MKQIYEGSVKNLFEVGDNILFAYSDRYSLFDWGEMPDHLENKGIALALMGSLFFTELTKHDIPHHCLGLADQSGNKVSFSKQKHLLVQKVPVTPPKRTMDGYDYSFYQTRPETGLVPLEVIFRFGVGKGSSLLNRVESTPSLLNQWGLQSLKENDRFEKPLIDFSTKLERGDRYLTHSEARLLAGLNQFEFERLISLTTRVAFLIKDLIEKMNLELWDGKLEWAFSPGNDRGFMLVDSIGLDELRVETRGQSLSKEFLREYYRKTPWFEELKKAKSLGEMKENNLRNLCSEPPKLPVEYKNKAEALYLSFTNDLARLVVGKEIFESHFTVSNWKANI